MKYYSVLIILLCLSLKNGYSQIPNGGFEIWSNPNGYFTPDSWGNLNDVTASSGIYIANRAFPGIVGSYFLDLTTKDVPGMGYVPGIVTSGVIDTATHNPISGFPYNQRPTALMGKWQYMGFGSDQGYISVILTKWNSSTDTRDTVGFVKQILFGMEMSWTDMYIPITYYNLDVPDSCIIVLSASGANPYPESFLYIDELAFVSFAGVNQNLDITNELLIYPNPAKEIINLQFSNQYPLDAVVTITNLSGQKVMTRSISNQTETISISSLSKGMYFINIEGSNILYSKKIIIN